MGFVVQLQIGLQKIFLIFMRHIIDFIYAKVLTNYDPSTVSTLIYEMAFLNVHSAYG